jgi:hypothetical protein
VTETALMRRRSARGWGARLAAFLSSLGFAFAVAIAAIQDYSYEITPSLSDGVDDDGTVPFTWMLRNDGMNDSSKQRVLIASAKHPIGSKSVYHFSTAAKSPRLTFRNQYRLPLKRPPLAERRASKSSTTDPD